MNIERYKDQIINLQSDFYQLNDSDKKALQEYINRVMYDIISAMKNGDREYVQSAYNYLVTLIEFAIRQSAPVVELTYNGGETEEIDAMVVSMLDYYMDGIQGEESFYKELEMLTAIPEKEMRENAHKNFWDTVENAILSVQRDFPDFLQEEEEDELDELDELEELENAEDKMDSFNRISIETALNSISDDLDSSMKLIRELYENIHNDGFLLAKRQMEIMLFRLSVLKYYDVSERLGQIDNQRYCMNTEEGIAYRLNTIRQLDKTFSRDLGKKLYETGENLFQKEEYAKSADYFKESALQGIAEGAYRYGDMLVEGQGCEKDEFTSSFWLWQASQMGNTEAMVDLGVHYSNGIGVWQSKIRGLYYFALAAVNHNPTGAFNVGISLEKGDVIQGNAAIGKVFKKAASTLSHNASAMSFVDTNAKVILEITAEALQKYEGGI